MPIKINSYQLFWPINDQSIGHKPNSASSIDIDCHYLTFPSITFNCQVISEQEASKLVKKATVGSLKGWTKKELHQNFDIGLSTSCQHSKIFCWKYVAWLSCWHLHCRKCVGICSKFVNPPKLARIFLIHKWEININQRQWINRLTLEINKYQWKATKFPLINWWSITDINGLIGISLSIFLNYRFHQYCL